MTEKIPTRKKRGREMKQVKEGEGGEKRGRERREN